MMSADHGWKTNSDNRRPGLVELSLIFAIACPAIFCHASPQAQAAHSATTVSSGTASGSATALGADETPGIRVPAGFRVELYADDELAHDIHSMTIDALGRVVVSGPCYVRILIDQDNDGKADSFKQFVDKPTTGSQGMFWLGRSLLCSGDDGLQIFRDDNRDDVADGPPEVFLRIAAGGEHHVHSIQQGPDGWWYVIAGNFAGVTGAYATLPTSPLKQPHNGVLLRLKPDLSGGEIVSDGMRNAYDFAFSSSGDIFTYDSDDERDISLPWYLPTRVFHLLPMSDSGWVSAGWKRPAGWADMPPVIGSTGRGSPTGTVCYQHRQFPAEYHGSLFVLDWTLGRILCLPLTPDGSIWRSDVVEFAAGKNQFGFAPTDIEVGQDGSLFVCVGGRGTRGSVYRIFHEAGLAGLQKPTSDRSAEERLNRILRADQPLSSWSRTEWQPMAKQLGAAVFETAARDEVRRVSERIRAIEILIDVFGTINSSLAEQLTRAGSPAVRARTAWAVGRANPSRPELGPLKKLLADREPLVQRFALEALSTVYDQNALDSLLPQIAAGLSAPDRHVRQTAAFLVDRLSARQMATLEQLLSENPQARMWLMLGQQFRSRSVNMPAAKLAVDIVTNKQVSLEARRDAVRLLQLALGDAGPAKDRPAMFDSYGPQVSLAQFDLELNPLRTRIADIFPSGDPVLDHELIRVIAMTTPLNRELLTRLLAGITQQSLPSEDIHRLAALAQFDLERSYDESVATAQALINIDIKIRQLGLKQDTNWDDRMGELFAALCKVDPAMPQLLAEQPGFGQPGHAYYMSQVPQDLVAKAIDGFVGTIQSDEDFRWSNDVVFIIGESSRPEHQQLLRDQLDNLAVRDAILMVLAESPSKEDRELFISGLNSAQMNAVDACVQALTKLPRSNDPAEQHQLLNAARRLTNNEREFRIRETVIRLLQNNVGQSGGFIFGEDGFRPQPEAMQSWQNLLTERYPNYSPASVSDVARQIYEMLPQVPWETGSAERGSKLFERLSCAKCHGGRQALGPDLIGITRRFSRDDLIAAIVEPNRDISSRYQTTMIETKTGRIFTGLIVYESIDGMLLRDAEHKTYRIEGEDIETRSIQRTSLMPSGLLKDTQPQDIADLQAYLNTL